MSQFAGYRATQAYRAASMTVSPLGAVVMLLDGAIRNVEKLVAATEAKRFEEGHNHLMKATQILRALSQNLNFDKAERLSEQLSRTYNALILACHCSFGRADGASRYGRIIASLAELRDAWATVRAAAPAPRK